jgi:hypothetical protein
MRPFLRLWALCAGLAATACTAQSAEAARQDILQSISIEFVDRTSHHCWIEFEGPRHHVEAQLARRGYRPLAQGARYRMRIEVTGERSEPFTGHVSCVGFLNVVVEARGASANARPILNSTLSVRASNTWPAFNNEVLRAIDRVIGEF